MQVTSLTPKALEFACHSKACAPPPAGRGGSDKSGGRAASGPEGFREGSHGSGNSSSTLRPTKGFVQHKDALKNAQAKAAAANKKMAEVNENRARYGQLKSGGSVGKQGVMTMTKQAAHRKEAARQIDLRNERQAAARRGTNSQTTHVRQDGTHGNRGGPVIGPKAPLYNKTTGRLNPKPVRKAFKQGTSEIIGNKTDSKRTTLSGPKVRTVSTYKGRAISHVSSTGRAGKVQTKSKKQQALDDFMEARYYQD